MAFASTVVGTTVFGDKKVTYGTFTNSGASSNSPLTVGGTVLGMICFVSSQGQLPLGVTIPASSAVATVSIGAGDTSGYWAFFGK